MVIRKLIRLVADKISDCDNHIFETHLIVRSVLSMSPIDLVLAHNREVDKSDIEKAFDMAQRRANGEPLVYIIGTQEFMGIEFDVDKNVLIPRQDTETLVETVLGHIKSDGATVLDICCGSGCIGLSVAYHNKRVYTRGVDISDEALKISKQNAKKLGLEERAAFEKVDVLTEHISGKYDVIASNPPYIRSRDIDALQPEVKDFEPHLALDGGADGLEFYRRIVEVAPVLLSSDGMLAFEVGYDQADDVANLMERSFTDIRKVKDLCGVERVVTGILKN